MTRRAFTLVELLVVVAVIALLIAILLPALGKARKAASAAVCLSNLRAIGQGTVMYESDNQGLVIPSYNMTGVTGVGVPLDGWGPILDRDGYMDSNRTSVSNPFYCPDTVDVAGVASGQTGTDPQNAKGWLDWPFTRSGTSNIAQTIPERRFEKIIRVSYWINADNPIGSPAVVTPDLYFTGSVGYGPGSNAVSIKQSRNAIFKKPSFLITVADGLYAGRQRDSRINVTNSRIGYRHPGRNSAANVAFADGHAEPIGGDEFPRATGGTATLADVRDDNFGAKPTVYANPEKALR